MQSLQKAGGIAALFQALAYVVGFAVMAFVLSPADGQVQDTAQKLAFVLARKGAFQAWNLFIYVAFGVALVVLTVALHARLSRGAPARMQVASAFGLIWAGLVIASGMVASVGLDAVARIQPTDAAQAATVWRAIGAVQDGLGGGVELVGGLWLLLLSGAAMRSNALPRTLAYLGIGVGAAGVLTVVPALKELGTVFGLGQIAWFLWIGIVLLRGGADMQADIAQRGIAGERLST